MTAKNAAKANIRSLPSDLADVTFLDIRDICAALRMSPSWVHDEVRAGRFPKPMKFGSRCSRWTTADLRRYLVERAERAQAEQAKSAGGLSRSASAAPQPQARNRRSLG
jgi:predicted DNA-binding transcriptional regulator AlpA